VRPHSLPVSPSSNKKKARLLGRWRGLVLTLGVITVFAWLDAKLKATGREGYCPQDASLILAAEDLPRFWQGIRRSDTAAAIRKEAVCIIAPYQLAIRKATGIRSTSSRWRLWMGYRFLAARSETGEGLCVHPGLLIRAADALCRLLAGLEPGGGARSFGEFFYAWRDGFLIVSRSRAYVMASLAAPAPRLEPSHGLNELRLQWRGSPQALVRLCGEDGLPVAGFVHVEVSGRSAPLTLVDVWPEPPLLSITASKWADLRGVWTALETAVHDSPHREYLTELARILWNRWQFAPLPAGWDKGINECALALAEVNTTEVTPIPELALVLQSQQPMRAPHPWLPLVSASEPIAYEWGDHPGWALPVLGEKIGLYLGRAGTRWLVATRETLLAGLVERPQATEPLDADVAITLNWAKAGHIAEALLLKAGELELFTGKDSRAVENDMAPFAQALGRLGTLRCSGRFREGRLYFEGFICVLNNPAGD
jgi:hypothetical protein